MTPARLAALEAVAEAARDAWAFQGYGPSWPRLGVALAALDALPPPPPAGATERVRVAVYRQATAHGNVLHAEVLGDGDPHPALTCPAILTADIATEPPPVPEVAATVEGPA